jgi:uncharacterized protein (TIGR02594 family)
MSAVSVTPFDIAQRFVGVRETAGTSSNPLLLAMLRLDQTWPTDDVTPWCSAFLNFVCWLIRVPRSKSLAARSWLTVGSAIPLDQAVPGFDVVVLQRGSGKQPGPSVIQAPGHVGFFAGLSEDKKSVLLLGGNQGDAVSVAIYPVSRILGIRRLDG